MMYDVIPNGAENAYGRRRNLEKGHTRLRTAFYFERKKEKRAGAEIITTPRSLSGKTGNLIEIPFRKIVHSN